MKIKTNRTQLILEDDQFSGKKLLLHGEMSCFYDEVSKTKHAVFYYNLHLTYWLIYDIETDNHTKENVDPENLIELIDLVTIEAKKIGIFLSELS
jgi:hypothetical protein